MLNILIVEDAFEDMKYCTALIGKLKVKTHILQSENGKNAIEVLYRRNIDLIFLDVNLPDMTGFELAEKIRGIKRYSLTPIVFVTAIMDNQLLAYKNYHCYEYIVKPINAVEFQVKIEALLESMDAFHKQSEKKAVIFVETENEKRLIEIDDILFIESVNRYIDIYTKTERIEKVKLTLKDIIYYIDNIDFARCHKSFVVNLKQVKALQQIEPRTWKIEFKDNIEYPCYLGRSYRKTIEEKIMNLSMRKLNE